MKPARAVQREDVKRGVFLTSEISSGTYERLVPEITRLRLLAPEPICLFIDSPGGEPVFAELLLRLIRAPRQDGQRCLLTTVCIGMAASAAADLLAAGDYAIAYSGSIVHVHGTRQQYSELTIERVPEAEDDLRSQNEYFAMKLASRMFRRFATQALLLEVFKTTPPAPNVVAVGATPTEILHRIKTKVQDEHGGLVDAAFERMHRMEKLYDYVQKTSQPNPNADPIEADATLLKRLVDFEASNLQSLKVSGRSISGFPKETVGLLREDFILLKEFLEGDHWRQSVELSREKGHYFLTAEEMKGLRALPGDDEEQRLKYLEEHATPKIFPLWYLVVALCRLLQQGEHMFSASDAWWFGLIDEVIGSPLPSVRLWRENRPNPVPKPIQQPTHPATT